METLKGMGRPFARLFSRTFVRLHICSLLRKFRVQFVQVRVGKVKIWIDLRDGLGEYWFVHQRYEPFETSLIEKLAKPGMFVLDVGANVGYYTVILASKVGRSGQVIAFEPDPDNLVLLRRNIQSNRLSNVVCEQAAVMSYEGEATLYRSSINYGDHRVFDSQDDRDFNDGRPRSTVSIRTVSLDKYLRDIGIRPDLVKMDIQGAEMLALPGMIDTLSNPNVMLFCEFWPYALRRAGSEPIKFLQTLKQIGFELFEIMEASKTIVPVQVEELSNRFADPDYANLIGVHHSRLKDLPFLRDPDVSSS
jgi:FkbM family methyltransferase